MAGDDGATEHVESEANMVASAPFPAEPPYEDPALPAR